MCILLHRTGELFLMWSGKPGHPANPLPPLTSSPSLHKADKGWVQEHPSCRNFKPMHFWTSERSYLGFMQRRLVCGSICRVSISIPALTSYANAAEEGSTQWRIESSLEAGAQNGEHRWSPEEQGIVPKLGAAILQQASNRCPHWKEWPLQHALEKLPGYAPDCHALEALGG